MTECEVNENELHKIALGACFLGSGGGGKLETSFTFIKNYCDNLSEDEKKRNLQIADLGDVKAGQTGIVVAYMGAPQKMDSIKCPDAICEVINKFGNDKGIDYIIPVEIGPVSTITACLTAHKLDKPVLNVDGAGRAVPTLDLITYTTNAGVSVNPTILCSENVNKESTQYQVYHQVTLTLEVPNDTEQGAASKMESLARPVLNMETFDQKAGLIMWYFEDVTKLMAPHSSVKGTLTFCQELGDAIQSKPTVEDVFRDIEELFKNQPTYDGQSIYPTIKEICRGTLKSATTSTAGGFDVGVITIEAETKADDGSEHLYTIIFQNESLILWDSLSATPLIMAPDLISYLIEDDKKQYVFTNGDIMDGDTLKGDLREKEIVVYGIAAPYALRQSQANIMNKRKDILSKTTAGAEPNELPSHYLSILNTVGYYGTYVPLE
ncbi:MAG: DUF917 family protein [Fibrobacter sp.]|nr:DUF917 family protein [Fibrobacter sp.]